MCWPKEMFHCSKNLWEWNKKTKSLKRLNQESLTTFHNNRVCLFSFFKELFSHEHWHFNHVCFVCHPPQLEWAADKSISFSLSLQRNKKTICLIESLCHMRTVWIKNYVELLLETWNDLFLSCMTIYTNTLFWSKILGQIGKNFLFFMCTIIWKAPTLCSPVSTSHMNWP